MKEVKRPKSVTWLSWLIIAHAVINLSGGIIFVLEIKSLDIATIITIIITIFLLYLIEIVLALGLLKGKNWARLSWLAFGLVYVILLSTSTVIEEPNLSGDIFRLIWIVSIFLLLKSDSTAYFCRPAGTRGNK